MYKCVHNYKLYSIKHIKVTVLSVIYIITARIILKLITHVMVLKKQFYD